MGRRLGLALGLTAALAGCGAARSVPPSRQGARMAPRAFAIVARWDARALGLRHPDSLAVGPDGNVYVTDASQRVTVISPRGRVLRRWGGPGEFHFTTEDPTDPHAVNGMIAVGANGLVYVSDSGNARVAVFTERGRLVRRFGRLGSRPGELLFPFDLAVDRAGDVFVVDDQRDGAVTKFSASGRLLWRLDATSPARRRLTGHIVLSSVDAHGRLVALEESANRVVYLDGDGRIVDSFDDRGGVLRDGCDVTLDPRGDTYVTGCTSPATLVFDRRHRPVAEWPGTRDRLLWSPRFGPGGEAFALRHVAGASRTADQLLKLRPR